jgi:hypothetical protein
VARLGHRESTPTSGVDHPLLRAKAQVCCFTSAPTSSSTRGSLTDIGGISLRGLLIPALVAIQHSGGEVARAPTLSTRVRSVVSAVEGHWDDVVKSVAVRTGVTAFGSDATDCFKGLLPGVMPAGCTARVDRGLRGCVRLNVISFPAGRWTFGACASAGAVHSSDS